MAILYQNEWWFYFAIHWKCAVKRAKYFSVAYLSGTIILNHYDDLKLFRCDSGTL